MQTVISRTSNVDRLRFMATLRENFAANLKRLIQESGHNQKSFAKELRVSEAIVSKWLNLVNFPEDTTIDRITKVLDIDYEALVKNPKTSAPPSLPDPVIKFLRKSAKERGYDLVKKS